MDALRILKDTKCIAFQPRLVCNKSNILQGPKEVFLKAGSELKLHCVVNLGGQGPDEHFSETAVLHWFLGQRLIDSTLSKEKEKGVSTKTKLLNHYLSLQYTRS